MQPKAELGGLFSVGMGPQTQSETFEFPKSQR